MSEHKNSEPGFLKRVFTTKVGSSCLLAVAATATPLIVGGFAMEAVQSYPDVTDTLLNVGAGLFLSSIAVGRLHESVDLVKEAFEVDSLKELAGKAVNKFQEVTSTKFGSFAEMVVGGAIGSNVVYDQFPTNALEGVATGVKVIAAGYFMLDGKAKFDRSSNNSNGGPKPPAPS